MSKICAQYTKGVLGVHKKVICDQCEAIFHSSGLEKGQLNYFSCARTKTAKTSYCTGCLIKELPFCTTFNDNAEAKKIALDAAQLTDIILTDTNNHVAHQHRPQLIEDLLQRTKAAGNRFKIAHQNIRSLSCKYEQVREFLLNQNCSETLSETWLTQRHTNDTLQMPGYVLIRNDRVGKEHGVHLCMLKNG